MDTVVKSALKQPGSGFDPVHCPDSGVLGGCGPITCQERRKSWPLPCPHLNSVGFKQAPWPSHWVRDTRREREVAPLRSYASLYERTRDSPVPCLVETSISISRSTRPAFSPPTQRAM